VDIGGKKDLHATITPLLVRLCIGLAACVTGRQD
jgi:hypothetical protein